LIQGSVKRAVLEILRERGKKAGVAILLLFAACLYLLLQDSVADIERIEIDTEYVGHEADIRAFLLRHVWSKQPDFEPWRIAFRRIGKKSPAHQKAEAVRKGRDPGYRKVSLEELLDLWSQK
jgi:hypothetical protein